MIDYNKDMLYYITPDLQTALEPQRWKKLCRNLAVKEGIVYMMAPSKPNLWLAQFSKLQNLLVVLEASLQITGKLSDEESMIVLDSPMFQDVSIIENRTMACVLRNLVFHNVNIESGTVKKLVK